MSDLRPGERTTRRAALRRAYSFANSATVVKVKLAGGGPAGLSARARVLAGGLVRLSTGSASYVLGSATRRLPWQANGARLMARGCGAVTGGIGLRYEEYAHRLPSHRDVKATLASEK